MVGITGWDALAAGLDPGSQQGRSLVRPPFPTAPPLREWPGRSIIVTKPRPASAQIIRLCTQRDTHRPAPLPVPNGGNAYICPGLGRLRGVGKVLDLGYPERWFGLLAGVCRCMAGARALRGAGCLPRSPPGAAGYRRYRPAGRPGCGGASRGLIAAPRPPPG